MKKIRQYVDLWRHMGVAWLLYRAGHAIRRRLGYLRRATPVVTWDRLPAPELKLHVRTSEPAMLSTWGSSCLDEAEAILRGQFRLFSHQTVSAGFPPDWHYNQLASCCRPKSRSQAEIHGAQDMRHWSDISDSCGGDIKGVWELNRFSWAYSLVRAYARTKDSRFSDAFWRLFADWCERNPPNVGPNWMCGQEAAFRLMAVVFAAESLGVPEAQHTTLARFVTATGRRIAAHLDFALSQANNHGISECVGLITIGLLLPNEKEAANWLALGTRHLETQLKRLVYDDGGFSQHSLVYHRVLLHDLSWIRWRLDLSQRASPAWLNAAAWRALSHLSVITDSGTGLAPLFGSNDGANILPLADTDFLDMRPVIQLVCALFRNELSEPPGAWDEAVAWMKSDWNVLRRTGRTKSATWHAPDAGYFQIESGQGRLWIRCPTRFRHRPAQADMLHVDVWHKGRPIAMDGGSFSYNSPERFASLSAAAHHNVITVDGQEPIEKFSRFLYLPWPKGTSTVVGNDIFQCSHNGYAELGITWIREVSASASGGFIVRDLVRNAAGHRLRWHWRLADADWCVDGTDVVRARIADFDYRIHWSGIASGRSTLLRADESSAYGWWSPYYSAASPAVALLLEMDATNDVECVTEFRPFL